MKQGDLISIKDWCWSSNTQIDHISALFNGVNGAIMIEAPIFGLFIRTLFVEGGVGWQPGTWVCCASKHGTVWTHIDRTMVIG